jgi:hypothetical protein
MLFIPFSGQSMPLRWMSSACGVQDFEGVAVEDGDDGTGEVPREYGGEGGNEDASRGYIENQQSASTGASNLRK